MVRSVVTAYPPRSDSRQLIAAGFFSMVAVDETGKPKNIPALLIESDEEWELENISRELREGRPRQRERLLSHLNFEGT
jgi:acyl-CoA hydrolase